MGTCNGCTEAAPPLHLAQRPPPQLDRSPSECITVVQSSGRHRVRAASHVQAQSPAALVPACSHGRLPQHAQSGPPCALGERPACLYHLCQLGSSPVEGTTPFFPVLLVEYPSPIAQVLAPMQVATIIVQSYPRTQDMLAFVNFLASDLDEPSQTDLLSARPQPIAPQQQQQQPQSPVPPQPQLQLHVPAAAAAAPDPVTQQPPFLAEMRPSGEFWSAVKRGL